MNNVVYGKVMESLRHIIDVKLVSNEKDYLKCTSNPSYISHKILDNILVAIQKSKVLLKFDKLAYIRICIFELNKIRIEYEFHYNYIKNKYDNKSKVFTDTDSLIYEIKTEDVHEDFSSNKDIFDFSNHSTKSKYYDDSNKLVIGKMKDETGGVAIKDLAELKPQMYSTLADDNSDHKKAKGVNRNVAATISHNEYKDVLLNNKYLRYSLKRIQSKDHRVITYEINKSFIALFY